MKITMTSWVAGMAAVALSCVAEAAVDAPTACQAAKNKEAASLVNCLATAEGKFVVSADADKYATAVSKCEAKFSDKWAHAEQAAIDDGGTCRTTGDETTVSSWLQARAACVATALGTGDTSCMLCGNGVVDAGEECDLGPASATCRSVTGGFLPLGNVECGADCKFDTAPCHAGVEVGGALWFAGVGSCDSVCASYGLSYDAATATFAGSGGSEANCAAVLSALGVAPVVPLVSASLNFGVGCFYMSHPTLGIIAQRDTSPTTSSAGFGIYNRTCACH